MSFAKIFNEYIEKSLTVERVDDILERTYETSGVGLKYIKIDREIMYLIECAFIYHVKNFKQDLKFRYCRIRSGFELVKDRYQELMSDGFKRTIVEFDNLLGIENFENFHPRMPGSHKWWKQYDS